MNRVLIIPILFTVTALVKTAYLTATATIPAATAMGALSPCLLYAVLLMLMFREKRLAFLIMGVLMTMSGVLQVVGGLFGVWDQIALRILSTLLGVLFAVGGVQAVRKAPARKAAAPRED